MVASLMQPAELGLRKGNGAAQLFMPRSLVVLIKSFTRSDLDPSVNHRSRWDASSATATRFG